MWCNSCGKKIKCNVSNYVPFVVLGLSTEFHCFIFTCFVNIFIAGYLNTENPATERSETMSEESRGNPSHEHRDTSSSSHELPMESRAKVEPGWGKHSIYTHFPKDPNCDICLKTKITSASCRRRAGTVVPRADNFGDLMFADHKVRSEGSESRNNHRYAATQ